MADTTTTHELLVTTFATADTVAKLLIEKGLINRIRCPAVQRVRNWLLDDKIAEPAECHT
jgi:DNA-binding MarR family transcriptional regulator